MKTSVKHIAAAMALCILSGTCVTPLSAFADEPAKPLYGDVNLDQQIDVSDAVLLARFNAEDQSAKISAEGRGNADVNRDGEVTKDDTLQILEYIAKKRAVLGVQQPQEPVSKAVCLTENLNADEVAGKKADSAFIRAQLGFTANLLRETDRMESAERGENEAPKNLMISPLSVSLALGMAANGAKGGTLSEMENLFGGDLTIENLNAYYADYVKNLPSQEGAEMHIANSIWARDNAARLIVPDAFLRTTKSYYSADFYKAPFDQSTVDDINGWVKKNTMDMIPKLTDKIYDDEIMYLINAVAFDGAWEWPLLDEQVREGKFTLADGTEVTADMMHDDLGIYLDDGKATGFMKDYKGGKYSFAAVLPNEGTTVADYIKNMNADSLQKLLNSASYDTVYTTMPRFSFDYGTSLVPALQKMGMNIAFSDTADLTGLNEIPGTRISKVMHKTFIQVDEKGTKAAAVTAISAADAAMPEEPKRVNLDRPFLFMIVDNENKLPVFIGYVMDPTQKPE